MAQAFNAARLRLAVTGDRVLRSVAKARMGVASPSKQALSPGSRLGSYGGKRADAHDGRWSCRAIAAAALLVCSVVVFVQSSVQWLHARSQAGGRDGGMFGERGRGGLREGGNDGMVSVVTVCGQQGDEPGDSVAGWVAVAAVAETLAVDWSMSPRLSERLAEAQLDDVRIIRVEGETEWRWAVAANIGVCHARERLVLLTGCNDGVADAEGVARESQRMRTHGEKIRYVFGNEPASRAEWMPVGVLVERDAYFAAGGMNELLLSNRDTVQDLFDRVSSNAADGRIASWPREAPERANETAYVRRVYEIAAQISSLNTGGLSAPAQDAFKEEPNTSCHSNACCTDTAGAQEWRQCDCATGPGRWLRGRAGATEALLHESVSRLLRDEYDVPMELSSAQGTGVLLRLLRELDARARRTREAGSRQDLEAGLDGFARSARTSPRLLVVQVMHGLGNRLRALGSAMAFARHTGRQLVVLWARDVHCQSDFGALFMDRLDNGDALVVFPHASVSWSQITTSQVSDYSWHKWTMYNYMEMEGHGALKDENILDDPERHIFFKSAYVMQTNNLGAVGWARENNELRHLVPVPAVSARVAESLLATGPRFVGVHVRASRVDDERVANPVREYGNDATAVIDFWRSRSSAPNFAVEMLTLVAADPDVVFFVATDSHAALDHLRMRLGARVRTQPRSDCGTRRDVTCMQAALADMLVLAAASRFLGSPWSSFTEAAQRMGAPAPRVCGVDFATPSAEDVVRQPPAVQGAVARLSQARRARRRKRRRSTRSA